MNFSFYRNVFFKGLLIFLVLGGAISVIPADVLGRVSVYNHLVPGRQRLPFGETPRRSYNLSLYNLEAMFASHEISAPKVAAEETRVIVLGDSSVWGTLLKPEETLTGQLNARGLQVCGKPARFYNLGYPTISLAKDVLILQRSLQNQPDMVVWLTTLEAFPADKQFSSPLAENNSDRLRGVIDHEPSPAIGSAGIWERTIFGQRRELADWARLQINGIPWAATGIDQDYPSRFPPAEIDLQADETFHDLLPENDLHAALAWDVLQTGMDLAKNSALPVLLVNEPILISNGFNSDTRYNFYYPRWAYDAYRMELQRLSDENEWQYLDAWNTVPMGEFTNSAIHLTPRGEELLAEKVAAAVQAFRCEP